MVEINIEEAKAYLKQQENNGTSIYDHLANLIQKLIIERPQQGFDLIEEYSSQLKDSKRIFNNQSERGQIDSSIETNAYQQQENVSNNLINMFMCTKEDNEEIVTSSGISDFLDESTLLEWAGIGFSKSEMYRLTMSLEKLARTIQTNNLRLCGKILGKNNGYYIAESTIISDFESNDPQNEEDSNGLNKYIYWAMKNNGEYKWIQLPNVKRQEILAARKLKRLIGDDLTAQLKVFPPFPGTEANFLRAQISRIMSSTTICPSGLYTVSEEGEIIPSEEPEIKNAVELSDISNWVHQRKEINEKFGRTLPMPKLSEDEESEELNEDEIVTPLRSLSLDKQNSWKVQRMPSTLYPYAGEVAVAKSLVWPGAVAIGLGKKSINFYVGYGLKYSDKSYQYPDPAHVQKEYTDTTNETKDETTIEILCEQNDVIRDPSEVEESEGKE